MSMKTRILWGRYLKSLVAWNHSAETSSSRTFDSARGAKSEINKAHGRQSSHTHRVKSKRQKWALGRRSRLVVTQTVNEKDFSEKTVEFDIPSQEKLGCFTTSPSTPSPSTSFHPSPSPAPSATPFPSSPQSPVSLPSPQSASRTLSTPKSVPTSSSLSPDQPLSHAPYLRLRSNLSRRGSVLGI